MYSEKKRQQRLKREGGFTLVEFVVVIAIILLFTGSVGFVALRYLDTAKTASTRSLIETYSSALTSYYLDCRNWPTEEQGLDALWTEPSTSPVPKGWQGPYLTKPVQADPWDNPFEYTTPGPNNLPFGIRSFGADGAEGGEGQNADITSWE